MAYDYREAVKDDVLEYINNEINFEDFDTLEAVSYTHLRAHET